MNKRNQLNVLCVVGMACAVVACNGDKQESGTTTTTTYQTNDRAKNQQQDKQPDLVVPSLSKQIICETVEQSKRLQYRIKFSDKLHFGVSKGRKIDANAPVAMHITKSEVRTFSVPDTAEYCFHFNNKDVENVSVNFSHKVM